MLTVPVASLAVPRFPALANQTLQMQSQTTKYNNQARPRRKTTIKEKIRVTSVKGVMHP